MEKEIKELKQQLRNQKLDCLEATLKLCNQANEILDLTIKNLRNIDGENLSKIIDGKSHLRLAQLVYEQDVARLKKEIAESAE